MSTRDILIQARDFLAGRPWYPRDSYTDGKSNPDCYCAATAIWHVTNDPNATKPETVSAGRSLAAAANVAGPQEDGSDWNGIFRWNDASTKPEVLAAFDKAIEVEANA